MVSTGTVNVVVYGLQLNKKRTPKQEFSQPQVHLFDVAYQNGRQQELDTLLVHFLVFRGALVLQVGVDRHLSLTPSTQRRDQVYGHGATAPLHLHQRVAAYR